MKKQVIKENEILEDDVEILISKADNIIESTIRNINFELINMYWKIGKLIVKYKKNNNSKYGNNVVQRFSEKLTLKYGKGFEVRNIKTSINLFKLFPKNSPTNFSKKSNFGKSATSHFFENISFSHYREIINLKDKKKVLYYLEEANKNNYTVLELRKSVKKKDYDRTIFNQRKKEVVNNIEYTLKDPIILEIENKKRTEKMLEDEIFSNILSFMKEIGSNITL